MGLLVVITETRGDGREFFHRADTYSKGAALDEAVALHYGPGAAFWRDTSIRTAITGSVALRTLTEAAGEVLAPRVTVTFDR